MQHSRKQRNEEFGEEDVFTPSHLWKDATAVKNQHLSVFERDPTVDREPEVLADKDSEDERSKEKHVPVWKRSTLLSNRCSPAWRSQLKQYQKLRKKQSSSTTKDVV